MSSISTTNMTFYTAFFPFNLISMWEWTRWQIKIGSFTWFFWSEYSPWIWWLFVELHQGYLGPQYGLPNSFRPRRPSSPFILHKSSRILTICNIILLPKTAFWWKPRIYEKIYVTFVISYTQLGRVLFPCWAQNVMSCWLNAVDTLPNVFNIWHIQWSTYGNFHLKNVTTIEFKCIPA